MRGHEGIAPVLPSKPQCRRAGNPGVTGVRWVRTGMSGARGLGLSTTEQARRASAPHRNRLVHAERIADASIVDLEQQPLAPWVHWVAQDDDGTWWGFEHEPNQSDNGWYENEVGRFVILGKTKPNPAWREPLRRL